MEILESDIYYAHRYEGGAYWHASPNLWWVNIHGLKHQIVMIRIRERVSTDPPSDYWGWLGADKNYYHFVFYHKSLMEMCFPYGSKAEEERGRGRAVNLIVQFVEEVSAEALEKACHQK